jgi:hypothetical protein
MKWISLFINYFADQENEYFLHKNGKKLFNLPIKKLEKMMNYRRKRWIIKKGFLILDAF